MAKYDGICRDAYTLANAPEMIRQNRDWLDSPWKGFFPDNGVTTITENLRPTGVDESVLNRIATRFSSWPDDFNIHSGLYMKLSHTCMCVCVCFSLCRAEAYSQSSFSNGRGVCC